MGTLATREPGILLSAVFELGKKGVQAEMTDFEKRLADLKAKGGFETFVTATRREGKKLMVKVLASNVTPPKGAKPRSAAKTPSGWGQKKGQKAKR